MLYLHTHTTQQYDLFGQTRCVSKTNWTRSLSISVSPSLSVQEQSICEINPQPIKITCSNRSTLFVHKCVFMCVAINRIKKEICKFVIRSKKFKSELTTRLHSSYSQEQRKDLKLKISVHCIDGLQILWLIHFTTGPIAFCQVISAFACKISWAEAY